MGLFNMSPPTSFRLANMAAGGGTEMATGEHLAFGSFVMKPHDSHPSLGHLTLLVFEAVMEVVCVSLPGYIVARLGHFDADKQKFLANLNVMLFTPCLIFTKLASQLNADKLLELGIIPVIFVVQTLVSYFVAVTVTRAFRFNKRASNFVTAMGVFGNSNSLPISLVISLSQTLKGLHWDKIPGDNDDEVAARGILYLLIFQQLGQLVRWSWGYHVLLAPREAYSPEEGGPPVLEGDDLEGGRGGRYRDDDDDDDEDLDAPPQEEGVLIPGLDGPSLAQEQTLIPTQQQDDDVSRPETSDEDDDRFEPAGRTPVAGTSSRATPTPTDSEDESAAAGTDGSSTPRVNGNGRHHARTNGSGNGSVRKRPNNGTPIKYVDSTSSLYRAHAGDGTDILSFPRINASAEMVDGPCARPSGLKGLLYGASALALGCYASARHSLAMAALALWKRLPEGARSALRSVGGAGCRVVAFAWDFMNPPLWAMMIAVVVASVPDLQHLFFTEGTFIQNSVTSAVRQSGGVAVPLILVVLGANLARNTTSKIKGRPHNDDDDDDDLALPHDPEEERIGTRLLVASLVCRMVLPTVIMAPFLAVMAKYVPISILDDPIFVIVCFLLTGAPSALQLAQICQINGVYEGVMSKILFQSYVIWILPSTLVLVMCALEVVEWANT